MAPCNPASSSGQLGVCAGDRGYGGQRQRMAKHADRAIKLSRTAATGVRAQPAAKRSQARSQCMACRHIAAPERRIAGYGPPGSAIRRHIAQAVELRAKRCFRWPAFRWKSQVGCRQRPLLVGNIGKACGPLRRGPPGRTDQLPLVPPHRATAVVVHALRCGADARSRGRTVGRARWRGCLAASCWTDHAAAETVTGRKRHVVMAADRRHLLIRLTFADGQDAAGAERLITAIRKHWPRQDGLRQPRFRRSRPNGLAVDGWSGWPSPAPVIAAS